MVRTPGQAVEQQFRSLPRVAASAFVLPCGAGTDFS